ncbi:MAG: hypothetical protein A2015_05510 [Spirochaetes bacterium GWF1_31_7]|nr:MAG: hypothetical protein A2Y30_04700 [Spirochaetes bacterium GWE1_32_154]OHD47821.1 MAG: hypothetical protein A2Y29_09570 [Spirochaetes bacterium GWE2_31_10]OHD52549.1 MAG: hypothetical protein A2015_05510 [Spirochaetes bacterium GWF1_31_7]OHD80752.1 MAG: hypothetical protein A2355_17525 [Spirochaetes bacterium RIFOXYB1_FULL_32_8]HBD93424.1 hypothetical protein [Spirochaetia bacterium]
MIDVAKTAFKDLIDSLKNKKITCVDIMRQSINSIHKFDSALGCFISVDEEAKLIKLAEESDTRRKSGTQRSDIDGLPVALKDNIVALGIETTCGSKILEGYKPSYDATSVRYLREAGAIIIGKTNMDEFAMGSTCETSAYTKTKNPHDIHRVPGGSSGGSAAAVASGMVPLALGSDTGGSVRQPASFCGVVGIKPTYGLVSRSGLVSYASSLDQIGTFANDVYGSAFLLNYIAKKDEKDSTSFYNYDGDYTKNIDKDIKGLKVAYFPEFMGEGVSDAVKTNFEASLNTLKELGATVDKVDFPAIKYIISTYYFIATAEASSNLSRYDGVKYGLRSEKQQNYEEMLFASRTEGFGKEVKKRILLGNFVLSSGYYDAYYLKAQKLRTFIMKEMQKIFMKYDVIATPTTPEVAFKFGEGTTDPMKLYLSDVTTVIPNLSGLPAISVPSGMVSGLPVGLQLIGKPLSEDLLFNVGYKFEQKKSLSMYPDLSKIDVSQSNSSSKKDAKETKKMSSVYSKEDIKKVSDSYSNREKNTSDRVFCTNLSEQLGKTITMSGSIYKINNLGGIEFYTLRDRTGLTQLVLEGEIARVKLTPLSIVQVKGMVTKEERSPYNGIELKVTELTILSEAASDVPFTVGGNLSNLNLPTLLDNRPISLRNIEILSVFKVQSEIAGSFAEFLRLHNFTEIKTPKIISNETEGGSNIFEIKYFDRQAFLAQSPQFYKQMMVGSGLERVFEIGPVFRAEKHNTVRHLNEYTSLDFEMAFIKDEQDLIDMQEALLIHILKNIKAKYSDVLEYFGQEIIIPTSIPRIHFIEALEIADKLGVKDMDGDISPEGEKVVCKYIEEQYGSQFVYIVGYPVKKRPMYTMQDERLPGYTRSFDLLYKGLEITTGGQRIHNYEALKANMIAFGLNPAAYKDYLETFKFGMPPHGGLGMGLERVTMKLLGLGNVREATLFPRDIGRLEP